MGFSIIHITTEKMKNKKGVKFLGEHVVNLVLAVIVIVFLIYLIVKVYTLFVDDNKLKKAEDQLNKLSEVINSVYAKGSESKIEFFTIDKGWYLNSYFNTLAPERECKGKVGCLCVCDDFTCENLKKCIDFHFSVQLVKTNPKIGVPYIMEKLKLLEPVYELDISKEKNVVKIKWKE